MKFIQNGNFARLVAFFVIAIVITCTVSFAANGWQSFIDDDTNNDRITIDNSDKTDNGNEDNVMTDATVTEPVIKYYHSITGLETDLETSLKRPLALTFSSTEPLYGISSSYLTIEFPTEYGNTRFLCFTDDAKTLGKIGSLAPTRGYISNLATYFGGILLSYGSDDTFEYTFEDAKDKLDFADTSGYCYTEYNSFVYTNGDLVNAFLNNNRINQSITNPIFLPYTFVGEDDTVNTDGDSALAISINFADSNSTQLNYSNSDKCYIMSKNSVIKNDLLNDKPLKYDNVFILFANSTTYETEDSTQLILDTSFGGSGIYATDGKYVEIRWEKDVSGNLAFYTVSGEQLVVNPGLSYIAFSKASSKSSVKIS